MVFSLLGLLLTSAFVIAVSVGLYLLGWRFQRILLPLLLLLVVLPFRNYAYEIGFALEFETDPARMSTQTAAFVTTSTWLLRGFYVTTLILTWRFSFLAPAAPLLLFLLFSWIPFYMLSGMLELGGLLQHSTLLLTMILMTLLLFSYTLPSLLRELARRAWLPEPLSQLVLEETLTYREKFGVFKYVLRARWN